MKQLIIFLIGFILFSSMKLHAQLSIGFNGGITYTKALNVAERFDDNDGTYEILPLLDFNINGFVNYKFKKWTIEAQFGEKTLGFRKNQVQFFTPNPTTAYGYRHPGVHPIHHFNKYNYNYHNLSLRLKRMVLTDLQLFIGINPMLRRSKFTRIKRTIRVPNPGKVIAYRWNFYEIDASRQYNLLLDVGVNYRIAKHFALELYYLIGLSPFNLYTEQGKLYHSGISTTLVVDFEIHKPKFLSKKR